VEISGRYRLHRSEVCGHVALAEAVEPEADQAAFVGDGTGVTASGRGGLYWPKV
jgi:hypothetical protein